MAAKKDELRYDEELAERARAAFVRAFDGLTQTKVGELIGTDQSTAGRYMNGPYQIPLRVLLLVSERLKVGVDDILQPSWLPSNEERFWAYARERVLQRETSGIPPGEPPLPEKAAEGIAEAALLMPRFRRNKAATSTDAARITTDGAEGTHAEAGQGRARRRVGKQRTLR